ncbi:MAG: DUF5063 domain-containing protein [Bacteroidales bacterium]|jgi:hypothetical protein|nr:DUF5063 domain-containing protein [Bacteroidales bacterium]
MENLNTDKTDDRNTKDLLFLAGRYCTFLENTDAFSESQITEYLVQLLAMLYVKGTMIPAFEIEDNSACEQFLTEEQYESVYLRLKEKIKDIDFFESYDRDLNETQTQSVCELLVDIYQDMKNFVLGYGKNRQSTQEGALWMVKDVFPLKWGKYISILLPYLHDLVYAANKEIE